MPILAESRYSGLVAKARLAIKMDIVKPTPATKATPIMWRILIPFGIVIQRILFAKNIKEVIPTLFPTTKQMIIVTISA